MEQTGVIQIDADGNSVFYPWEEWYNNHQMLCKTYTCTECSFTDDNEFFLDTALQKGTQKACLVQLRGAQLQEESLQGA